MPHVQINHPEPTTTLTGSCDRDAGVIEQHEEIYTDPAVHVSWQPGTDDRDGHVQVALECDRSYFEKFPDEDRGCRYSPPLSRRAVNRMIDMLRDARDEAFGPDV